MKFEDGFVAYLNGQEIAHFNAPGRDGNTDPLGFRSTSTTSRSSTNAASFFAFDITQHRDLFLPGENVLAFHGLNQSMTDREFLLLPRIVARAELKPEAAVRIAFNEITAADSETFHVEIANDHLEVVNLEGFVLSTTGENAVDYILPAQSISAGGTVAITAQQLGFKPEGGDNLFLYTPGKEAIVDGRPVTGRLRGRSAEHDGQWLYSDTATPGAANGFAFEDSVVINEIMYHGSTTPPVRAQPPTFETTTLLPLETTWRRSKDFNFGGNELPQDLGPDWASVTHDVDGVNWLEGPAPLGNITRSPVTIATNFARPNQIPNPITTYYFETDLGLTQEQIDQFDAFAFEHWVDDGAVFYVNGHEVDRYNMPGGEITAQTFATNDTRTVGKHETATFSRDRLVALPQTNRISVEVHQSSSTPRDILFGLEMEGRVQTDPGFPFEPAVKSAEEWIELVNRGSEPVDLSGWTIRDAVSFDFPAGTTLEPGEYLVIAADAEELSAKYPNIHIGGQFRGRLSDHDDRIRLLDANENPADEVHYFESGDWAANADGGGSSLELRNPYADNSNAAAWAASDETTKSQWQTYTYRKLSQQDVVLARAQFNEFVLGLLDDGEFLIDDITVIQDPDGQAMSLLQNGTFEGDTIGQEAEKWRIIGTHQGTVIADPDDPSGKVLHIQASGPHQFVNDYGSTTFVDDTDIVDGDVYEFSFRAKWLAGNSQLNTRLYFNRAGHTTALKMPTNNGTPGAVNSTFVANVGPTYAGFGHQPVVPTASQDVTVSVQAEDSDGIAQMTLWWKIGTEWTSTPMTSGDGGPYAATISPQAEGEMVQFYVEGQDALGVTSTYPAAGAESRALYQVDDGGEAGKPNNIIDTFRFVYLPEDADLLFPTAVRQQCACAMTNRLVPFTLVHNNTAFYDVGIRLIGSRWVRPESGFKIQLGADSPFYGVHDSIRFDSDRVNEIVMKQMVNRAGGTKSSAYNDLSYLVLPEPQRSLHTHVVVLELARFEALYLDEQFENGSEGAKFELDDVTRPSTPTPRDNVENPKMGTQVNDPDIGIDAETMAAQGSDPEFHRGHVLIKSQRARDDYETIVKFAQAIHLEGDELYEATQEIMDIDLWMRHYAHRSFLGDWDTYGFRRAKNLRLYVRPEDGKTLPFAWDADQAQFSSSEAIYTVNENKSRLDEIRDLPANLRLFWGHMLDEINRSFNPDYASYWVDHYGGLTAGFNGNGGLPWDQFTDRVRVRTETALAQMEDPSGRNGGIAKVPFEITSNGGQAFQVDSSTVTLAGTGWIDIRRIHLQDNDAPLEVTWTDVDKWEISLPLALGQNDIRLQTFDYQGNELDTDSVVVTSTVSNPVADSLRITEINYNPHGPMDDELAANPDLNNDSFEFIELQNVGAGPINLLGTRFADGVQYTFPLTLLEPDQRGVLVKDAAAFELRYGAGINLLGTFEGSLNNGGEQITLVDGLNQTVVDVQYGDRDLWTESADGLGATLQLSDPAGTNADRAGKFYSWTGSANVGGSPGTEAAAAHGIVINEVLSNTDDPNASDSIELYNTGPQTVDIGGWYLSDSSDELLKYQIPAGTTIAASGYVVFDESHFNPSPQDPANNHFALSGRQGDDVWLVTADGGQVTRFVDDVHFGATANGESLGRANGSSRLAPLSSVTLGAANSAPRVGPFVISELSYNPGQPVAAALAIEPTLTRDDLEYVEVTNPTAAEMGLHGLAASRRSGLQLRRRYKARRGPVDLGPAV